MLLPWAFGFTVQLFADLLGETALFYELFQFLGVFLAILIIFIRVICLETDGKELKCALFGSKSREFRSSVP